jgi:phospholipase C
MVAAGLTLLVGLSACATPSPPPSPGLSSPRVTTSIPHLDHVVVILEENKPAAAVIDNPDAPFLNALAQQYASATNYSAITHPSLPNYLALVSGSTGDIANDCSPDPSSCAATGTSIAQSLEAAGLTWRMYAESMTTPCAMVDGDRYAVRHNPFVYFSAVTNDPDSCADHVVPFSQFAADLEGAELPALSFISPDLCSDMHDCSVATGDAWLAREVPKLLDSPAFSGNSLLVITFDEGSGSDNRVALLFAGPAAARATTSNSAYTHYSLLHTIEAGLALPTLSENDAAAPTMQDLLAR